MHLIKHLGIKKTPALLLRFKYLIPSLCLVAGLTYAHSVGQVQTTKFFAPETVQLLKSRIGSPTPGIQVGDVLSYIIQFAPVANNATVGVAGYITDYLPPGVEVVGASIVNKDASGNYVEIAPSLPGGIDTGWGRGSNNFLAPFNTNAYDPTGLCAAGGFTNNCEGRLTELHADTGIFFSTDPRTAVFPALPTRIAQEVNGYNVSPTAEGQLNPIIGQTNATTHNLWDASMTNAFGSTAGDIAATAAPKSTQIALMGGTGAAPFMAASPVAGPQTGYTLDYTGAVGPWQRIAYNGSRIGDPTTGPATNAGASLTAVGGLPTASGVNVSLASPLPAGTNAVRWAVGKLVVGEIRYVKISIRVTAPPPASGIVNSSEVWGGDAGDASNGQDNPWRYHVPSVADTNSNLFLFKEIVCVYSGTVCVPNNGNLIPANAKVRYQISYLNSGNLPQTNVVLQDILPCNTGANAASNITIVSGSITVPTPNPPVTAAGNCPATRRTVTFPTLSSLAPGDGGVINIDVQTNTGNGDTVINTARLSTAQVPAGISGNAISTVGNTAFITIDKTTSTPITAPGGSVTYSIRVTNNGSANATNFSVYDVLPSNGGAANPATRFSFLATSSISAVVAPSVLPAPAVTTTIPPNLAPYSTAANASNTQQVQWNFGAAILAPGASFTLSFTVQVGNSVTVSNTPYNNNAAITYGGGSTGRADANNAAPVIVGLLANLSATKTNSVPSVDAGATTTYIITYRNEGPSAASGARVWDIPNAGLQCSSVTCTATAGGAACPSGMILGTTVPATSTTYFSSSGVTLPSFPANSSVTLAVVCGVTASGQP